MKERPILFNAPMVRAILAGTKTQTRRALRDQPCELPDFNRGRLSIRVRGAVYQSFSATCPPIRCPYGQPGDRLWVREAFRFLDSFDKDSPATVGARCLAADYPKPWAPTQYEADGGRDNWMNVGAVPGSVTPGKLRPGIHMPRWASRITLEITGVRVERLQDISEADAWAEGIATTGVCYGKTILPSTATGIERYLALWESINGPDSWAANPWVWVVEFKRVRP